MSPDSKGVSPGMQFDYESLSSSDSRRAYFRRNGYVVRRGLIDKSICMHAAACFEGEIKPYRGYLYRQASANPEKHEFNSAGKIMNSLLNPLSVCGRLFPAFRAVSDEILSSSSLFGAVCELYSEPAMLVQSMYFEGNPATWPHQDSYYLDADTPGALIGAWIALEDIHEEAGRFYVLPGSHEKNVASNAGSLSIGMNHDRYKQRVRDFVRSLREDIVAPVLRRGDVLLWSSKTVHGATEPRDPKVTRHSYTAHFIPVTARFMQYECIPVQLNPVRVDGNLLCRPKDQDRLINRLVMSLETCGPRIFPRLKKAVIAHKISHRAGSAPR